VPSGIKCVKKVPDKLYTKMKFSMIIAEQNILTQSDVKIWMDVGIKLDQSSMEATPGLKQAIAQIKTQFPELPNQIVWGNYLVFDEHGNIVTIDIDCDDIDLLKKEILKIAFQNDLVVLIGRENKIYRDI